MNAEGITFPGPVGTVWQDKDAVEGQVWTTVADGVQYSGATGTRHDIRYVERTWGPMVLVSLPIADGQTWRNTATPRYAIRILRRCAVQPDEGHTWWRVAYIAPDGTCTSTESLTEATIRNVYTLGGTVNTATDTDTAAAPEHTNPAPAVGQTWHNPASGVNYLVTFLVDGTLFRLHPLDGGDYMVINAEALQNNGEWTHIDTTGEMPAVAAFRKAIATLAERYESAREDVKRSAAATQRHVVALRTVFEGLKEKADEHDWCDEYEEGLEELASSPAFRAVEVDPRDYTRTETQTFTVEVTLKRGTSIAASSIGDAIENWDDDVTETSVSEDY